MSSFMMDLRLTLTVVLFVYIVGWAVSHTGSKGAGIIVGSIVAYLTVYQHWEFVVLITVVFFGWAFFMRFEEATRPIPASKAPSKDDQSVWIANLPKQPAKGWLNPFRSGFNAPDDRDIFPNK